MGQIAAYIVHGAGTTAILANAPSPASTPYRLSASGNLQSARVETIIDIGATRFPAFEFPLLASVNDEGNEDQP